MAATTCSDSWFSFFTNPCTGVICYDEKEEPLTVVTKEIDDSNKTLLEEKEDSDNTVPPLVDLDEKSVHSDDSNKSDDGYDDKEEVPPTDYEKNPPTNEGVTDKNKDESPTTEVVTDQNPKDDVVDNDDKGGKDMTFWEFLSSKIVIDFKDLGHGAFLIGLRNKCSDKTSGSTIDVLNAADDDTLKPTIEEVVQEEEDNSIVVDADNKNNNQTLKSVLSGLKEAQRFFFYPELSPYHHHQTVKSQEFLEMEPKSTSVEEPANSDQEQQEDPAGTVVLLAFQPQAPANDESTLLNNEKAISEEERPTSTCGEAPKGLDASVFEIQDLTRSFCCVAFSSSSTFKEADARKMLNALIGKEDDDSEGVFMAQPPKQEEANGCDLQDVKDKECENAATYLVNEGSQTMSPTLAEDGNRKDPSEVESEINATRSVVIHSESLATGSFFEQNDENLDPVSFATGSTVEEKETNPEAVVDKEKEGTDEAVIHNENPVLGSCDKKEEEEEEEENETSEEQDEILGREVDQEKKLMEEQEPDDENVEGAAATKCTIEDLQEEPIEKNQKSDEKIESFKPPEESSDNFDTILSVTTTEAVDDEEEEEELSSELLGEDIDSSYEVSPIIKGDEVESSVDSSQENNKPVCIIKSLYVGHW